ncbi:MAG: proline iminopeptidase-family hydrolase [Phycisphaerales bacterium]|nr:proline iminopeptidase-family hydrolase [Phycisphaerales bacterium]
MPATGMIDVEGGRVWYQITGSGTGTPLLVLHGGPGIPHDYLQNLERLGEDRPVIFYDQLGCGRSDRPDDTSLWTEARFARELDQVRKALGLKEVILYGHSWGTILAVDYDKGLAGARPSGVRGLILAGPALSIPRWIEDSRRLIAELPPEMAATILDAERAGQTDTDAYKAAMHEYYMRHVCRLDPWPDALNRAFEGMGEQVYLTMEGPSEFTITGSLKDLDLTPYLSQIHAPTLYICGQYDEATPDSTRYYASLTPRAEVVVIKNASHLANLDQPEACMLALRNWLATHGL